MAASYGSVARPPQKRSMLNHVNDAAETSEVKAAVTAASAALGEMSILGAGRLGMAGT